jgi:transposase InsO family protein
VRNHGKRHHMCCTRPYTPKTNGKAERFIQTSLREWAYAYTDVLPTPIRASRTSSSLKGLMMAMINFIIIL